MIKVRGRVNSHWVTCHVLVGWASQDELTHWTLSTLMLIRFCQTRPYALGQTSPLLPFLPAHSCAPSIGDLEGGRRKGEGEASWGEGGRGSGQERVREVGIDLASKVWLDCSRRQTATIHLNFYQKLSSGVLEQDANLPERTLLIRLSWFSNVLTKLIFIFISISVWLHQTPFPSLRVTCWASVTSLPRVIWKGQLVWANSGQRHTVNYQEQSTAKVQGSILLNQKSRDGLKTFD